jgi:hypothetical protein
MRYRDLIEANTPAQEVWKQTSKSHEALRKLRARQADAADALASARSLPQGPERTRRMKTAGRHEAEARSRYGSDLSKANDARAAALQRAERKG